MADLRSAVSNLKFDDLQTYLQSGNMVFRAGKASNGAFSDRISAAIRDHAGMDVSVMVRSVDEWSRIVKANPYPQANAAPKTVHVFVLDEVPDAERLAFLAAREAGREEYALIASTIYLHTPDGFGRSVLGGSIERILKVTMTARNWNTVLALEKLATRH